jgi:lysophospholipase L1-like esterase
MAGVSVRISPMTKLRLIAGALALLVLPSLSAPVRGQTAPAKPEADSRDSRFTIPATDEGLPGAGPIRRYDWFRNLWVQKRSQWHEQKERDRGAVVFLGDSITQGWGDNLGGKFPEMKVANRGISGDTTRGVLIRLREDVLDLDPAGVVLLIGTNDLEEGAEPEVIAANLKLILRELKRHNARMPVVLCQVFPSSASKKRPADKIREINALYAEAVKGDAQVTLVKTWNLFADDQGDAKLEEFPDLLHPNTAGYEKWAASLRPVLGRVGLLEPKDK